jgi:hypothetical protein
LKPNSPQYLLIAKKLKWLFKIKYYMLKNDNRYFIDEEEFNQLGQELYKN